jgi:hypothetical protein
VDKGASAPIHLRREKEVNHLESAKQYLAIAESADSKREAYKAAAEEIAVHKKQHPKDTWSEIAISLGKTGQYVGRLMKWRTEGYPEGTTPFTMPDPSGSKPTDRAAISHGKKVLRENPDALMATLVADDRTPEEQQKDIQRVRRSLDKVAAPFVKIDVVASIQSATEEISRLIEQGAAENLDAVFAAYEELGAVIEMAKALGGVAA